MEKKAQATNVFPSQSIEHYFMHGPEKVEHSNENFFQENDTKFVLDFMRVKEKYNELRQNGKTHGQAWRESKAYTLPLERQMLMKQEIKDKNPGFYLEENHIPKMVSKSAQEKMQKKSYWNISYSKEDIDNLMIKFSSEI